MFCPEYIQWQNVVLLYPKMCKNIIWMFLMLYPKVNQVKSYNLLIYLTTLPPPPHISDCQHVFLLFGMSLRHLDGWLSIIQKFPRDLISVDMVPD